MTHVLCGLILPAQDASNLSAEWNGLPFVALHAGLTLIPLSETALDSLFRFNAESSSFEGFVYLDAEMLDGLKAASSGRRLAYVETDYFGGVGGQGAVMIEDRHILFGPDWAEIGPINSVLAYFDLPERKNGMDRFDQVGLGRHRRTEDWL